MMASSEADATRCASGALTSLCVGNGFGADKDLSSSTGDWDIVPSSPWTLVSLPKSTSSSISITSLDSIALVAMPCVLCALPLGLPQAANLSEKEKEVD